MECHSTESTQKLSTYLATITTTPTTTKASILDIPGATLYDQNSDTNKFSKPGKPSNPSPTLSDEEVSEWLNNMKQNNSILVGYIKDYTSILVPDGKDYYHVVTMEIHVLQNVSNIEKEIVKAVYVCRYEYLPYDVYKPQGIYQATNSINVQTDQFLEALNHTESYIAANVGAHPRVRPKNKQISLHKI